MDTRVRANARDLVGLITILVLGSSALSSSAVTTVSASLDRSFHFRQRCGANRFPAFVELINNWAIRVNKCNRGTRLAVISALHRNALESNSQVTAY